MDELTIIEGTGADLARVNSFSESLFYRFINYTDVKEITLKGYTTCLKQFFIWLKDNNITNPEREDIKNYKAYLDEQAFTAGTKAQYLRAVKHFFKWASSEGLYKNVADNIKGAKVKHDNSKKEAFTEADIKTILESIDQTTEEGKRNYLMILLSVTGGLRIIEMQRADIADLQTIKGQKVLYIQGKGRDEKDEYIKIVPELEKGFEEYFEMRNNPKKNEPLFASTGNRARGGRLAEPSISRIIKNVFKESGFDCSKLTAHSLRHTSNTLLFKATNDLYKTQRHARHADPKTTEIYIHAVEREKDQSEQTIYNQIFTPGKEEPQATTNILDIIATLDTTKQLEALQYLQGLQLQSMAI
ncbi:MAG: tyrosine-type recombinase/integrase [Phascolarctobacterium sp.]|nr:tyrosine-type recombinase/integrase [Candidatus Phascolarctobacterium caballi]